MNAIVGRVLSSLLGAYVDSTALSNLSVKGLGERVELNDCNLKIEAIDALMNGGGEEKQSGVLPKVLFGSIRKLVCHLPGGATKLLSSLWSGSYDAAINITIDGIFILLDKQVNTPEDLAAKRHLMQLNMLAADVEAYVQRLFELVSRTANPGASKTSFSGRFLQSIVDSLHITVTNVHIRYEDSLSNASRPFAAGLTAAEVSMEPVEVPDPLSTFHRNAKIHFLSAYLEPMRPSSPVSRMSGGEGGCGSFAARLGSASREELYGAFQGLITTAINRPALHFLLHPELPTQTPAISCEVQAQKGSKPRIAANMRVSRLAMALSRQQASCINDLSTYLRETAYMLLQRELRSCDRPTLLPVMAPAQWWLFCARFIVRLQCREGRARLTPRWDFRAMKCALQNRKTYMSSFSKVLDEQHAMIKEAARSNTAPPSSGKNTAAASLLLLESNLRYEQVLQFRAQARLLFEKHILPSAQASTETPAASWLSWWSAPPTPKSVSPAVELSAIKGMSGTEIHEMHGLHQTAGTVICLSVDIERGSVGLDLDSETSVGSVKFDGLATYEQSGSITTMTLGCKSLRVFDGAADKTAFRTVIDCGGAPTTPKAGSSRMIFDLRVQQHPEVVDVTLSCLPLQVIISPAMMGSLSRFALSPGLENVSSAISEQLGKLGRRTANDMYDIVAQRTRINVHGKLEAPVLICPMDILNSDCTKLVFRMGRLSLATELPESSAMTQWNANLSDLQLYIEHSKGTKAVTEYLLAPVNCQLGCSLNVQNTLINGQEVPHFGVSLEAALPAIEVNAPADPVSLLLSLQKLRESFGVSNDMPVTDLVPAEGGLDVVKVGATASESTTGPSIVSSKLSLKVDSIRCCVPVILDNGPGTCFLAVSRLAFSLAKGPQQNATIDLSCDTVGIYSAQPSVSVTQHPMVAFEGVSPDPKGFHAYTDASDGIHLAIVVPATRIALNASTAAAIEGAVVYAQRLMDALPISSSKADTDQLPVSRKMEPPHLVVRLNSITLEAGSSLSLSVKIANSVLASKRIDSGILCQTFSVESIAFCEEDNLIAKISFVGDGDDMLLMHTQQAPTVAKLHLASCVGAVYLENVPRAITGLITLKDDITRISRHFESQPGGSTGPSVASAQQPILYEALISDFTMSASFKGDGVILSAAAIKSGNASFDGSCACYIGTVVCASSIKAALLNTASMQLVLSDGASFVSTEQQYGQLNDLQVGTIQCTVVTDGVAAAIGLAQALRRMFEQHVSKLLNVLSDADQMIPIDSAAATTNRWSLTLGKTTIAMPQPGCGTACTRLVLNKATCKANVDALMNVEIALSSATVELADGILEPFRVQLCALQEFMSTLSSGGEADAATVSARSAVLSLPEAENQEFAGLCQELAALSALFPTAVSSSPAAMAATSTVTIPEVHLSEVRIQRAQKGGLDAEGQFAWALSLLDVHASSRDSFITFNAHAGVKSGTKLLIDTGLLVEVQCTPDVLAIRSPSPLLLDAPIEALLVFSAEFAFWGKLLSQLEHVPTDDLPKPEPVTRARDIIISLPGPICFNVVAESVYWKLGLTMQEVAVNISTTTGFSMQCCQAEFFDEWIRPNALPSVDILKLALVRPPLQVSQTKASLAIKGERVVIHAPLLDVFAIAGGLYVSIEHIMCLVDVLMESKLQLCPVRPLMLFPSQRLHLEAASVGVDILPSTMDTSVNVHANMCKLSSAAYPTFADELILHVVNVDGQATPLQVNYAMQHIPLQHRISAHVSGVHIFYTHILFMDFIDCLLRGTGDANADTPPGGSVSIHVDVDVSDLWGHLAVSRGEDAIPVSVSRGNFCLQPQKGAPAGNELEWQACIEDATILGTDTKTACARFGPISVSQVIADVPNEINVDIKNLSGDVTPAMLSKLVRATDYNFVASDMWGSAWSIPALPTAPTRAMDADSHAVATAFCASCNRLLDGCVEASRLYVEECGMRCWLCKPCEELILAMDTTATGDHYQNRKQLKPTPSSNVNAVHTKVAIHSANINIHSAGGIGEAYTLRLLEVNATTMSSSRGNEVECDLQCMQFSNKQLGLDALMSATGTNETSPSVDPPLRFRGNFCATTTEMIISVPSFTAKFDASAAYHLIVLVGECTNFHSVATSTMAPPSLLKPGQKLQMIVHSPSIGYASWKLSVNIPRLAAEVLDVASSAAARRICIVAAVKFTSCRTVSDLQSYYEMKNWSHSNARLVEMQRVAATTVVNVQKLGLMLGHQVVGDFADTASHSWVMNGCDVSLSLQQNDVNAVSSREVPYREDMVCFLGDILPRAGWSVIVNRHCAVLLAINDLAFLSQHGRAWQDIFAAPTEVPQNVVPPPVAKYEICIPASCLRVGATPEPITCIGQTRPLGAVCTISKSESAGQPQNWFDAGTGPRLHKEFPLQKLPTTPHGDLMVALNDSSLLGLDITEVAAEFSRLSGAKRVLTFVPVLTTFSLNTVQPLEISLVAPDQVRRYPMLRLSLATPDCTFKGTSLMLSSFTPLRADGLPVPGTVWWADVKVSLVCEALNELTSQWEPILEPWKLRLNASVMPPTNSSTKATRIVRASCSDIQLNVSYAFVTSALAALATHKKLTLCNKEVSDMNFQLSECVSMSAGVYRSIGTPSKHLRYCIRNDCGSRIALALSPSERLPTTCVITSAITTEALTLVQSVDRDFQGTSLRETIAVLEPGEELGIQHFELADGEVLNEDDTPVTLLVQIEGVPGVITVNDWLKLGSRVVSPAMITGETSTPVPVSVYLERAALGGRFVITLRSVIEFQNDTGLDFEICVPITSGGMLTAGLASKGKVFALPIFHVMSPHVFLRPVVDGSNYEVSAPIKLSASPTLQLIYTSRESGSLPVHILVSISASAGVKRAVLSPALQICNLIPCAVAIEMEMGLGDRTLAHQAILQPAEFQECTVFPCGLTAEEDRRLSLGVASDTFRSVKSSSISLRKRDQEAVYVVSTIDSRAGGALFCAVSWRPPQQGGGLLLTVFSPFWCVSYVPVALNFGEVLADGRVVPSLSSRVTLPSNLRASTGSPNVAHEMPATVTSVRLLTQSAQDSNLVLSVDGQWSTTQIDLTAVHIPQEVVLSCGDQQCMDVIAYISAGTGAFSRTQVLTIYPKYHVVNTANDTLLLQLASSVRDRTKSMSIAPMSSTAVMWNTGVASRQGSGFRTDVQLSKSGWAGWTSTIGLDPQRPARSLLLANASATPPYVPGLAGPAPMEYMILLVRVVASEQWVGSIHLMVEPQSTILRPPSMSLARSEDAATASRATVDSNESGSGSAAFLSIVNSTDFLIAVDQEDLSRSLIQYIEPHGKRPIGFLREDQREFAILLPSRDLRKSVVVDLDSPSRCFLLVVQDVSVCIKVMYVGRTIVCGVIDVSREIARLPAAPPAQRFEGHYRFREILTDSSVRESLVRCADDDVSITVNSINVSVIDKSPTEISNLAILRIKFDLRCASNASHAALSCDSIQIDDMVQAATFPVVARMGKRLATSDKPAEKAVSFAAVFDGDIASPLRRPDEIYVVERLGIHFGGLQAALSHAFLMKVKRLYVQMDRLYSDATSDTSDEQVSVQYVYELQTSQPFPEAWAAPNDGPAPLTADALQLAAIKRLPQAGTHNGSTFFVKTASVNRLSLSLSYAAGNDEEFADVGDDTDDIFQGLPLVQAVAKSNLRIKDAGITLHLPFPAKITTIQDYLDMVATDLPSQFLACIPEVLLSIDAKLNPVNLIKGFGGGALTIAHGIGTGDLMGAASGIGMTVNSAAGSVAGVTDLVAGALSIFSEDAQKQRQKAAKEKPTDLLDGMARGATELSMGLFKGITGIVQRPVQGFMKGGLMGAAEGLVQGAVGVVVTPVAGAVGGVTRVLEGVEAGTTSVSAQHWSVPGNRIRQPRVFYGKQHVLRPLNAGEIQLWHCVKSRFASQIGSDDLVFSCVLRGGHFVLTTSKLLVFVGQDLDSMRFDFETKVSRIVSCVQLEDPRGTPTVEVFLRGDAHRLLLPFLTVEAAQFAQQRISAAIAT